jgi:uncharacterized protein YjbI with pentapeptide repeats
MVNEKQLSILKQGVRVWNKWREENPDIVINLSRSNFQGANLEQVNLNSARLSRSIFCGANLLQADLNRADLYDTDLSKASLVGATVRRAKLSNAKLCYADLRDVHFGKSDFLHADLTGANLSGSNLEQAQFVDAKLQGANLTNCYVYGVSSWNSDLNGTIQNNLVITPKDSKSNSITVDDLEAAQFIYMVLNNRNLQHVINSISSKGVLILGRFTPPERKIVLETLREKLREFNLIPIVFDFDRPVDQDFTETIKTLAGLSYFVIVDITNPKSAPLELQATVPDYQIPFVPIIQEGEEPFSMMANLQSKYNWMLDTISYDSLDTLIDILKPHIIDPAMRKREELRIIKEGKPTVISGKTLRNNK